MNWRNILNKICAWGKTCGAWLKGVAFPKVRTAAIVLLGLLLTVGVFIRPHWKPLAIGGLILFLFALLVAACTMFSWYVILAFLLLMLAIGAVIGLKCICQIKLTEPGEQEPYLTQWGVVISKIVIPLLGVVGPLLGVVGTLCGLFLGGREFLSMQLEKQAENTRVQIGMQADSNNRQIAAEQFKNAIEFLKSENQTAVQAGVQTLFNLATTQPNEYSQPVFEVLCNYLRESKSHKSLMSLAIAFLAPKTEVSSVTQTIVDKLFCEIESRKFYQGYKANLSDAILRGVNLPGANLDDANLQRADLYCANLQKANLKNADLRGADLTNANLQGADLTNANLQGADLSNANLQGADLSDANLQGAILKDADLRGSQSSKGYTKHIEIIKEAIKKKGPLETDLSGIILYDDKGNKLNENGIKEWFRERGANVDDLSPEEVQGLFKDWVEDSK